MESNNFIYTDAFESYKKLMNSLIFEKPSSTAEVIREKRTRISQQAKILIVPFDELFRSELNDLIDKISFIKPGRKLLKAINKKGVSILVIKDSTTAMMPLTGCRGVDLKFDAVFLNPDSLFHFQTFNNLKYPFKNWIILAHELIHLLHFPALSIREPYYLPEMHNLEEEHTIAGFNYQIFVKKESADKIDVLCENAFHLALNEPFRIDHKVANENSEMYDRCNFNFASNLQLSEFYYKWLEDEIRANISNVKKSVFENNLPDIPKNIFLIILRVGGNRIFSLFPDLSKDKKLMLYAIISSEANFQYIPPELFLDKDFMYEAFAVSGFIHRSEEFLKRIDQRWLKDKKIVFEILNILSNDYLSAEKLFKNLHPSLQQDAEIVSKLEDMFESYKNNLLEEIADRNSVSYPIADRCLKDLDFLSKVFLKLTYFYCINDLYEKIDPTLKYHPDIINKVLERCKEHFYKELSKICFREIPQMLKKEKDVVVKIVEYYKKNPNSMYHITPLVKQIDVSLKNDPEIKKELLNLILDLIKFDPSSICSDIEEISTFLADKDFVLNLIDVMGSLDKTKKSNSFIKINQLLEKIKTADTELFNDPDIESKLRIA